jgi:hypothetical protein
MSQRRPPPDHRPRRVVGGSFATAVGVLALLAGSAPAHAGPEIAAPASVGAGVAATHTSPATVSDAMHCAKPAHRVHFKRHRAVVAVAVGMAESYCDKDAVGHNPPTSGCPDGSDDRGLWQINSCYHPEVSDHCAFRPTCNARAAKRISDHGKDWSPWSAYDSGAYRQFLSVAKQAVDQVWGRT